MLRVIVQSVGKVTVFRCQGRIVKGNETMVLWDAVLSRTTAGTSVLDLTHVESIDAGGLGLLVDLCKWTRLKGMDLKLVNVRRRVEEVLKLTNLDQIFEISPPDETDSLFRVPKQRLFPVSRQNEAARAADAAAWVRQTGGLRNNGRINCGSQGGPCDLNKKINETNPPPRASHKQQLNIQV